MLLFRVKCNLTSANRYLCGLIQINSNMKVLIVIAIIVIVLGIAFTVQRKKDEKANKDMFERMYREEEKEKEKEEKPLPKEQPIVESPISGEEEEPDDEYDGLSYEEKMATIGKDCEKYLFETVSSLELSREQKEELIPQFLSTIEQHPDETKILKAVVRKLFKTLIDRTPDLMKRVDYQERFDEEKEELRSRDYVVIDSQWNQFLDDFDDLKADLEALQEKPQPKPQRSFGISTMETRTDEVDGQPCLVANFAVKGLFFRSPEDQDAARTLKVGDPLHMEHEEGNEKDPNAMKVTMADGHHIGYVDSKCSGYVRENQPKLLKFVVSKVDDYADPPYIYAEAFFKKE